MRLWPYLISIPAILIVSAVLAAANWPDGRPLPADAKADTIVIEKKAHELLLIRDHDMILKAYRIALGRGGPLPKSREGDGRTPEGIYSIDRRNVHSSFYRALHISYPSPEQQSQAAAQGRDPGGEIMIHGLRNHTGWLGRLQQLVDWTDGCIAVTDPEMDEILRAVPDGTPVIIRP